ncbi:MAG: ImmA/IrrE family metallo-endopeptidase [Actinobacteria bacterium]|nr:ImmA/IrrE family metallo-endopeptidase [Actinomycetota bacterium]
MLEDLESAKSIERACDRLLTVADARGVLPTPVDRLVAAAELTEPEQSALSPSVIEQLPAHLQRVVSRLKRKVHAVLDRRAREIHLNPAHDVAGQGAFKRLHETSHYIFEWQNDLAYADDSLTLSPTVQRLQEQEANQGAAELLFQRGFFSEMASDYPVGFSTVIELSQTFGSSIHSAFRRYVESHRGALAGVVLAPGPCQLEPLAFRRCEALCSGAWREQFEDPRAWPTVLARAPFGFVDQAQAAEIVKTPAGDLAWRDRNQEELTLRVEAFHNTYRTFVLIWKPQRETFKRRRGVILPQAA